MQPSMITLVVLSALTIVGSSRVKIQEVKARELQKATVPEGTEEVDVFKEAPKNMVKCSASGEKDRTGNMYVAWGVEKTQCMALCGPTRPSAVGFTYEAEFTNAFKVSFNKKGKCECSAGGEQRVTFKARTEEEASACNTNAQSAKELCWTMYVKARGTRFKTHGSMKVPNNKVPFSSKDFVVSRGERLCKDTCEGASCNDVKLPSTLDGMDRTDLAAVGGAAKLIMAGKPEEVNAFLKELVLVLPEKDLDDAEFEAIDLDGDRQLSVEELAKFYPKFTVEQIQGFVNAVDDNGNGDIDPEEFSAFKEQMRNFNPAADLITGEVEFTKDENGAIKEVKKEEFGADHEVKGEWRVTQAECYKAGKPAPASECDGTAEDFIDSIEEQLEELEELRGERGM